MNPSVVCLGEAIVDFIAEGEAGSPGRKPMFSPYLGGTAANTAVAAARAGISAALLGGLGEDVWGRWLRAALEHEGVDTGHTGAIDDLSTPIAFVEFDRLGEPAFVLYGDGPSRSVGSLDGAAVHAALADAQALIVGSNTLVGQKERRVTSLALDHAAACGVAILVDPNLRQGRWDDLGRMRADCLAICPSATVLRMNEAEGKILTGKGEAEAAAEAFCELGVPQVVVTLGSRGAVMRGVVNGMIPAPPVRVLSTMGAGDALMGTLAAGLARRAWDLNTTAEALKEAVLAGSTACRGWSASSRTPP